jgi:flagellar basal-body rod modification protein FlgD
MKVSNNIAAQLPASPTMKQDYEAGKAPKENVGDVANRVASSGKAPARVVDGKGNPKLDKDSFFKLMLTHLKNQDPTSPLKSHEMAAQLAQFSSLEQMSNINEVLKDMNKGQVNNGQFQALDLIGKFVTGDSSRIERQANDVQHPVSFNLPESAENVKIAIKDSEGKVIKNIELKNQAKGVVKLDWDGKNIEGQSQAAGIYKVHVEAKSASGAKVPVASEFKGQVTGVQFTEKGPIVFIGNKQIPLKEIKQIEMEESKKTLASANEMAKGMSGVNAQMPFVPQGNGGLTPEISQEQIMASLMNKNIK